MHDVEGNLIMPIQLSYIEDIFTLALLNVVIVATDMCGKIFPRESRYMGLRENTQF